MSRPIGFFTIVAAFLFIGVAGAQASTFTFFSVGNSLTQDSSNQGLLDMATADGFTTSYSRQIHAGASLSTIWNTPNNFGKTLFPNNGASYSTALALAQNVVTLEPFQSPLTGTGTIPLTALSGDIGDIDNTVNFMNFALANNAANVNTQFYIFARWTSTDAFAPGYDEAWNKTYDPNDSTFFTTQTADYFNKLITAVRAAQPQNMKPIELIPTGFVFDAIDKQLRAAGMDSTAITSLLYQDDLHANELGSFIAEATFAATIFKTDPEGMAPPAEFPDLTAAQVAPYETTIWNVVNSTNFTGVPEPTTLTLAGIVGLFAVRRRA
jgi:hypothetical protein